MFNYNSPINDTKNYSDLKISEIEPTIKINLRSKKRDFITKIGKSLSIMPPTEANTSSGNENLDILWLSPDEWMIYSNEKIDLIYIDPPYNTGKKDEFKYNDHWVDENDSYRFSKWLSFMKKRLAIT